MTLPDPVNVTLKFARVLYVNGQSTEQTIAAAEEVGRALGLRATVIPRWGELELTAEDRDNRPVSELAADPTGIDMERVAAAMGRAEELKAGLLTPSAALSAIELIGRIPPSPTWLFTLASGVGAAALSIIFGAEHRAALVLILLSAAVGAIVRRGVARWSTNLFVQPFCAALLAGVVGGLAVRYQLSSSLRLVAVCPCMVLLPGAHILNSALDLVAGRLHLGAARLLYALLIIAAISTGLLLGLALLGVTLPVGPPGRSVPLWEDVVAAGVAVFAFTVFFSMPFKMLPWAAGVGMLAHAARWATLTYLGLGVASGALVACVLVGLILTPVSRRYHMPFAAIGFASVVSLMPGVYLFRMASGLVQIASGATMSPELLSATVGDGMTAVIVILAMGFGLVASKLVVDRISQRQPLVSTVGTNAHGHADLRRL